MARSHIDVASKADRRERARTVRIVVVFGTALVCLLIASFAASRYFGPDFGPEEAGASPACIAKLYSPYNPKSLEQCMAVCINCSGGVKTTCSTACTLRGAR